MRIIAALCGYEWNKKSLQGEIYFVYARTKTPANLFPLVDKRILKC